MANGTYMDPKGAQMTVQAFSEGWWPTVVDLDGSVTFGPPKTKTSVRTVTLPRSVMADLVHHMNMNVKEEPGALLFIFQNGTPIRRSWFRGRVWLPADVVEQFKQSN